MKTLLLLLVAACTCVCAQTITHIDGTPGAGTPVQGNGAGTLATIINTDFDNVAAAIGLKQATIGVSSPIRIIGTTIDCPTCVTTAYVLTSAAILSTLTPGSLTNSYLATPNVTVNGTTCTLGGSCTIPTVPSVFGRTGPVTAASGDYSASQVTNAVDATQSYSNPSWLTGLAWAKVLGAPAGLTINGTTCTFGSPCTVSGGGGGSTTWGAITGSIASQADLASALLSKQTAITTGSTAQYFRGDFSLATFPTFGAAASHGPSITINSVTCTLDGSCTISGGGGTTYTFSSPIVNTSGNISIQQATNTAGGYLTAADWITFNAKQSTTVANLNNEMPLTFTSPLSRASNTISLGAINLASGITGVLPVANGGSGTGSPAIVAGTNVTVTGTWPNQTINASGGGSFPTATAANQVLKATGPGTTYAAGSVAYSEVTGTPTTTTTPSTGSGPVMFNSASTGALTYQQAFTFSAAASRTITAVQHGASTNALAVFCYDTTVSPAVQFLPATVSIDQSTFQIVATFSTNKTGYCTVK